jgi:hypothetical protein
VLICRSSRLRSRITAWASAGLFQSVLSSAFAFSSSRRLTELSQSKRPPQQFKRLLDFIGHGLDFGSHSKPLNFDVVLRPDHTDSGLFRQIIPLSPRLSDQLAHRIERNGARNQHVADHKAWRSLHTELLRQRQIGP